MEAPDGKQGTRLLLQFAVAWVAGLKYLISSSNRNTILKSYGNKGQSLCVIFDLRDSSLSIKDR